MKQKIKVLFYPKRTDVKEDGSCPLLYDLTTLQKEANTKHGFSAEQTLSIAQKLYEAKLITYPRPGSKCISEAVFAEVPALLLTLKNCPTWGGYAAIMGNPTRRNMDDTKITDHHAHSASGVITRNRRDRGRLFYSMHPVTVSGVSPTSTTTSVASPRAFS